MKETTQRESTLSTYVVMACTLGSRILGFVRSALIGAIFGAGSEADVLYTVFRIPNNMRKLLAEGALSSAFIPELSKQLMTDESGKKAKKLTSNILGLLLLIIIPLTLLFMIFPGAVISVLTHFADPDQTALAVSLLRYMISYIFFVSISALLMAVLNSHNRFFIPAITPVFFSIAVISSIAIFHKTLGVYSMAMGVILGGAGQIIFQLTPFKKLGYSFKPDFNFRSPEFRRVMIQWGPILLSSSIFSVNQFVAGYFATLLPEGSVSALDNSIVFWQLPFGLFCNSIITVNYPKLSRQAAGKEWGDFKKTILYGWRGLLVMLLPSSLVLMMIGSPLISVALQRGAFTLENTLLASQVLFAYCTGMIFVGAYNFTQRAFYALTDFKTPIKGAIIVVTVDLIFTVLFLFYWDLGIAGLAYANSIAYFAGMIYYVLELRRRVDMNKSGAILSTLGKVILSLIPGALWLMGLNRFLGDSWWRGGSSFSGFGWLALYGCGFVFIVLLCYRLLKVEFLSIIGRRRS